MVVFIFTGCCAVGSAPALGAGGREFESRHSDIKKTHDVTFEIRRLSWVFLFDFMGEIVHLDKAQASYNSRKERGGI